MSNDEVPIRDKARLVATMRSINPRAPGIIPCIADWFAAAADVIEKPMPRDAEYAERVMNLVWMSHDSPHLKHLAVQALHYLWGRAEPHGEVNHG